MPLTRLSYTKTPYLVEKIRTIEDLRIRLHMLPLSLSNKSAIRWATLIDRVQYAFELGGIPAERNFIEHTLRMSEAIKPTTEQAEVIRYKNGYHHILQHWLANPEPVKAKDLIRLNEIVTGQKVKKGYDDSVIQTNMSYLQTSPDNPIIQSALATCFVQANQLLGHSLPMQYLIPLLFLYKYGYDFRRFITLEEYFVKHKDRHHSAILQSVRDSNATAWLEFVAEATEVQLIKRIKQILNNDPELMNTQAFFTLNHRQQSILASIDKPGAKITNRDVQKLYKVSAITAARDLSNLAHRDLIIQIGGGRSTFYIRK